MGPRTGGASSSTDNTTAVLNQAGRRRLRGKQPAAQLPPIAHPAPKPRAICKTIKLQPEELNDEEKSMLQGLSGIMKNHVNKLITHNRAAVQNDKHYIQYDSTVGNINGQLSCRDCQMTGKLSEWKFFSKVANCKRPHGGESMVRVKMRQKAVEHNLGAADHGKHIVELEDGLDRYRCTICGDLQ